MSQSRYEKGNGHRRNIRYIRPGREVDVPPQEVVDWNVPLPTKLQPVRAVPPVAVEVSICKAGDFCKGAEQVLPDYKEDQQKGDHEGEEK